MANQQLVDYVKKQLDAGYDASAIEQVLVRAGYKQKDIDSAVNDALMGQEEKIPKERSNKWVWIVIAIIVLGALGAGAYFFVLPNIMSEPLEEPTPEPAVEPPVVEEPAAEPITEEPVIEEPVVEEPEEVVPDIWIDPPEENATYEIPIRLPDNAFEFEKNETIAITFKLYRTEFVEDLQPKVNCDLIESEDFVTYPYEAQTEFGEQAEITFVMKGQSEMVFTDCSVDFSTTDARELKEPFTITILP